MGVWWRLVLDGNLNFAIKHAADKNTKVASTRSGILLRSLFCWHFLETLCVVQRVVLITSGISGI